MVDGTKDDRGANSTEIFRSRQRCTRVTSVPWARFIADAEIIYWGGRDATTARTASSKTR